MQNQIIPLSGIVEESVVDGSGIRFTLFVQGCPHRCKGCHNPSTHPLEGGKNFSISSIYDMIKANPLLSGATFSGGEPFLHSSALGDLAQMLKKDGLNIWCYSGYTYDELKKMAESDSGVKKLLNFIDVLVDGRFEEDLKDLTLNFKGSSNQRIINLNAMRNEKSKEIILLKV